MRRQILIGPDTKIAQAGGRPPRGVLVLLVEQVGLFLLWAFADGPPWFAEQLGASAAQTLGKLQLWQPLTALFIHLNAWNLILNALTLWIFGSALERWWGTRRFVLFWVLSGVVSLIAGVLVGQLQPATVLSGSAGATAAMLVAFALIFPEHLVFFYGLIPLKAKHLTPIFLGFVLIGSLVGGRYLEAVVELTGAAVGWWFMRRRGGQRPGGKKKERKKGNGNGKARGKLKVIQGGQGRGDGEGEKKYWN